MDYDKAPEHLNSIIDEMDSDGNIYMPTAPGLGEDINFDHIKSATVSEH